MPGAVFPAFLKLEHQQDGSARSSFLAEVAAITGDAEKQFQRSFGEINGIVKNSLSGFKSGSFSMSVDIPGLKQVAADATFAHQRLIAMRDAAQELARASGDTSQATRSYLQALSAQTIEADNAKRTADAQVLTYERLQEQIDRTTRSNTALAASYRETFLAQAQAENLAHRSQQAVNAGFAPGLNRPTKSAAASASVFENQSYAPKADTSSGIDRMLAGAASIDRAALSAVTLDQILGRISAKGPQVAAALTEAGRASEQGALATARALEQVEAEQNAAGARAAAALQQLSTEAAQLRSALDPTLAAQQRFDAELERADRLLEAGTISTREYAAAQTLARNNLAESYTAIMRTGDAQENVAKRGTSSQSNVINSTRASRAAFLQLGQQMQDVAVQAQMGTNAFLIFGQQVPQAAFALTGLSDSANKTQASIGKMATFMAGPWGAAIFIAIAALGPFVAKLFETGDEADKATKKVYDFSAGLDVMTLSANASAEAMKQLADATKGAVTVQGDFLNQQADIAKNAVTTLQGRLKADAAELHSLQSQGENSANPFAVANARRIAELSSAMAANRLALTSAQAASDSAELARAQRDVANSLDAGTAATNRYNEAVGKLNARRQATQRDPIGAQNSGANISDAEYRRELTKITRERDDAIKAARDAQRPTTGARDLAAFGSPAPGARITSGYGTRERPTAGASTNHLGIDYAVPIGTPVLAAMDGVVKFASMVAGYGNQIELNHGAGTASRYSHLSRFNVTDGQQVSKGDVIGYSGKTGVATGPHLHYEVLVNGKKVDPGKGNFPVDATRVAEQGEQARAAAQRTADALQAMGERSAESIQRVNEQFNVQPKLIDQAAQATRKLDDIIKDLGDRKPAGFEQMIADAQVAKGVIQDALVRPFAELTRDSERRVAIQTLLTSGRDAEANALQTIWQLEERLGPLSEERKRQVYAIADAEEKANKALEVRREEIGNYLNATRSIRSELEGLFSGKGANFGQVLKDLQAKLAVEKLFGPALRQVEDFVKGGTGIDKAVSEFNSGTTTAGEAAVTFADTLIAQANRISSASAGGLSSGASDLGNSAYADFLSDFDAVLNRHVAANDNGAGSFDPATGEITVNGAKASVLPMAKPDRNTVGGTTLTAYSEMVGSVMTKPLIDAISSISPELAAKLGPMLNGAIGGMMTGGIPGAVLGGLKELPGISKGLSKALGKGLEGAQTGSMVAGISKSLGIKMSNTGAQIGGAIGSFIPIPGGSLIGSVVGGLLGNLFKKVQSGYAQIRPSGDTAAVTGTYGRTAGLQENATKAANSLLDTLGTLAQRLGGTLGGFDLDVGTKDEKFVVTSSRGGTQSFATEEEAIRYAIKNAIMGGAIKGVRDGTQRLLQAGSDVETQLQKAMDFESVFKRLRAQTDPVGAAIDAVDTEFKRLQDIFKEAGASTAEYADLEKLYGLERTKAIKDAASQMTGALKGLLDDLTIGDNGLSLSDRRANAMAKYQPLAAQVKAGDVSAYDDFAAAARSLIDISREMYGSQNPYFELFNEVKGITQGALDASTATANQSAGSASIFAASTASNDNTSVVSAIDGMNSDLVNQLTAANINLGILIKQGLGSGDLQSLAQYVGPMWQPQGYF